MEQLRKKAELLNIVLDDEQLMQFDTYYQMLMETNKVMNLTAITEKEAVIDKHFIDSIALGNVMELEKQSVIDIGTGAGFPGIPLKIAFPHLNITLIDSLNKRVCFLNLVIETLKLNNIIAAHFRAEECGQAVAYREQFDVCVSRAVANLSVLSEYCIPLVKKNGYFVAYKSKHIAQEVEAAGNAISVLGGQCEEIRELTLPETDMIRKFLMIKKISNTPKTYPRKAGFAKQVKKSGYQA